jgi:hypothetical protein
MCPPNTRDVIAGAVLFAVAGPPVLRRQVEVNEAAVV